MRIYILIFILFLFTVNSYTQNISYEQKILLDSNTKYRYYQQVKFPQIVKYEDKNIQNAINEAIRVEIGKTADEFFALIKDIDISDIPKEFSSTFESDYIVYFSDNKIFSFTFEIYQYSAGAAHPYYYSLSMNFNLDNGKLIYNQELFSNEDTALKFISDYCFKDLKRQAKEKEFEFDDEWLRDGLNPQTKNYQNISIAPDGLLVILNPYQVAPYVFGQQFVTVPYSLLRDKLNPDGPLKIFIK